MRLGLGLLVIAALLPGAAVSRSVMVDIPSAPVPAEQAPIALLVDLSAGQTLFARGAEQPFLPASMTKAMTLLVAFDLIKAGKLSEKDVYTVRPATAQRLSGRGTSLWLQPGETVTVRDLLHGIATASANDAAVALAEGALGSEAAWIAAMNARASALGMAASRFASANGLPDGGRTTVTARDMVRLAQALIVDHPDLYRRYFGPREMVWKGQMLFSRNPLAGSLSGADGIKTGHTREAGYTFLGAVERGGRRLVLVVGRSPTEAARANAARDLAEWGYSAWDSRAFLSPDWVVGSVAVQGGDDRSVPVVVARPFALTTRKGERPAVSARIVYTGPIRAPIAKGQPVGGLEVTVAGEKAPHYLPLIASQAVGRAGPIDRLVNGLLGPFQ